jgi:hypothetical protein
MVGTGPPFFVDAIAFASGADGCYDTSMDERPAVRAIAARILPMYRQIGGLSFAYGQGSLVMGFTDDADLDLVLVWDRAAPPAAAARPVRLLNEGPRAAEQFDQPGFCVDHFWVGGQEVDVPHLTRTTFDTWLSTVRGGSGGSAHAYPQPLAAVAGFAYGILLADETGAGSAARVLAADFPPSLAANARAMLAERLPRYRENLDLCARRDDGWLFHTILDGAMRDICVAWFAAHGRYLPFHKRLHHWIARFALEEDIASLERALWHPGASLPHKADLLSAMAERVLALRSDT